MCTTIFSQTYTYIPFLILAAVHSVNLICRECRFVGSKECKYLSLARFFKLRPKVDLFIDELSESLSLDKLAFSNRIPDGPDACFSIN